MRKNDLRATIGGIRARDELVTDTMDKIARYRTEQCESRGGSFQRFGLGLRIAAAACALLLFVGIGFAVGYGNDVPDVISHENNTPDTDDGLYTVVGRRATDDFKAITDGLGENWMIVSATVESCSMMDEGVASVSLGVNEFVEFSKGFEFDEANITAEFAFDSQSELDEMINSIASERYFLISYDTDGNLAVKKYS